MSTHRPLSGVVACSILGIIAGQYWPHFGILSLGTTVLLILSWVFLRKNFWSQIFLYCALITLGAGSMINQQTLSENSIEHFVQPYDSRIFLIEGTIVSDVQKRTWGKTLKRVFTLKIKRFCLPDESKSPVWTQSPGIVLVDLFRDLDVHYGDHILLEGKPHPPFTFSSSDRKFSYRDYLRQKGIRLILSVRKKARADILNSHRGNFIQEIALQAKEKLKSILEKYLRRNAAGLMNALILGERYDISKDIKELFIKTGTAHILAISGFNVGIVAFLVFLILNVTRLKRTAQYLLTIIILIFYALLTGAQASVVRSTVMAVVFLLSFLLERETDSLNSLALSALLILGWNPMNLFDVGFQLSFVSVFFITQISPQWWRWVIRRWPALSFKPMIFLLQSFLVSVAACLGVTGLIAYYFHIVTPVTILANLIIIPLTSLITALGLGLIFVGFVCPFLGPVFSVCIEVTLNGMIALIYFLSKMPGAYFSIRELTGGEVFAYYAVVLSILNWQKIISFALAGIKWIGIIKEGAKT